MKIILLGGGTGGHFYPLMAVAEELRNKAEEDRIVTLNITFMGEEPYDSNALREQDIFFEEIPAGKVRRYFSLRNFSDTVKTARGIMRAVLRFTTDTPDIIFSKGGYDSFPTLVAARLYRIPVIIHESDSIPGLVNKWASRFAKRIAISFPEASEYFPQDKVALTGHPIRHALLGGSRDEAFDIFSLESGIPTVLIVGASQGAKKINDVVLSMLPEILEHVQIIHSTGLSHIELVKGEAEVVLERSNHKKRYHPYGFLNQSQLRNASFVSDVAVARSGAGNIFEIAAWGLPSIFIPLPTSAQDHQRENAYNYARTRAAEVVEEGNLTPHLLIAEIMKILQNKKRQEEMRKAAKSFARIDAARKIAEEVIRLGYHE